MPVARLRLNLLRFLAAALLLVGPGLPAAASSAAAPPPPPALTTGDAGQIYGGPHLSACGWNASGTQTSTATSFTALLTCSLTVSSAGHLIILASSSVGLVGSTDSYEATFRLSLNQGSTGDPETERVVDVFPDDPLLLSGGDGVDRNVAITGYYTVTAGVQNAQLLVKRTEGTATMEFINSTLSVLFIPDSTDLLTCGYNANDGFQTGQPSSDFLTTAECSLDVPRPGLIFASGDGKLRLPTAGSSPFEAAYRLTLDDSVTTGVRYTDVYTNTSDGVDTGASVTRVYTVTAGVHTVALQLARQRGPGDAWLDSPGLAVLYVPFDSPYAKACGAASTSTWFNSTTTYSSLASCALTAPTDGWVFMSGNAGIGYDGAPYEGRFGLARDTLTALAPSSHYVNSYADANDGLDGVTVSSVILPNTAGAHTYYFVGRRSNSAAATVLARTGVVFVLVPGANIYLPQAIK